jgi:hypothetical protein
VGNRDTATAAWDEALGRESSVFLSDFSPDSKRSQPSVERVTAKVERLARGGTRSAAKEVAMMLLVLLATLLLGSAARAHEYMHVPPGRTGACLLNGVIMGDQICQTIKKGDDQQCLDDPLMYAHLFHVHPAYDRNACGGSTQVVGLRGGSQGILQECGDIETEPTQFNMSLPGPAPKFVAGAEAELTVKGFFHQGVMRMSLCYMDDSDCSSPEHFNTYVLGYHFTEGTATNASSPDGIYGVVMPFNVRMPRRTGRAVLQWLVAAEDVRAYVSCSTVEIVAADGATSSAATPTVGTETAWTCNGHPLCNCTTHEAPTSGAVGLGLTCPQGIAASVANGSATGTDIVKQYKEQVGVEAFCELCISNGCPSTCGGVYNGFYQGPKCTNRPTIGGCSAAPHATMLPKYIECTESTCLSSGWAPSPAPAPQPAPAPTPSPSPSPTPGPEPGRSYCTGNACKSGWVFKTTQCPATRPVVSCWNTDNNYKCCAKHV